MLLKFRLHGTVTIIIFVYNNNNNNSRSCAASASVWIGDVRCNAAVDAAASSIDGGGKTHALYSHRSGFVTFDLTRSRNRSRSN